MPSTVHSRLMAVALIALAGGLLASCASLSKEECLSANWHTIGYTDGAAGRTADYIAQHQEACARVNVTPDLNAWLAGREQGLPQYCTPVNAYAVGRRGSALSPVCPEADATLLASAHSVGSRYHEIGRAISDLESEVVSLEGRIEELTSDDWRERDRLRDDIYDLNSRIVWLRSEQSRYASWPPVGAG